MVCNYDPRLPSIFMKHVLTQARKVSSQTADRWQKEYEAWVRKVKSQRPRFFDRTRTVSKEIEGYQGLKKRRLSVDKRMVMDNRRLYSYR